MRVLHRYRGDTTVMNPFVVLGRWIINVTEQLKALSQLIMTEASIIIAQICQADCYIWMAKLSFGAWYILRAAGSKSASELNSFILKLETNLCSVWNSHERSDNIKSIVDPPA